jgi:exodeoxyribonuclease III
MIVATWNLNSVRAREGRLVGFLERARPDVLCLQETKVEDGAFPRDRLRMLGYASVVHGQRTYNGVAILARVEPEDVRRGLDDGADDPQARLVSARVAGVRVVSVYVPNGSEVGSDKYAYKLRWLERLRSYLDRHHDPGEPLALCGDLNVAPDDLDVADPPAWRDTVLCHTAAREALARVCAFGLTDVVRRCHPAGGVYSWWDYRGLAFPRNHGLRIDHVLATEPLARRLLSARVDRDERKGQQPSDHAPVLVTFADPVDPTV